MRMPHLLSLPDAQVRADVSVLLLSRFEMLPFASAGTCSAWSSGVQRMSSNSVLGT